MKVFKAAKDGSVRERGGSLAAWIFTVANHLVIDYQRSRARKPLALESDRGDDGQGSLGERTANNNPDPREVAIHKETNQRILALLHQLPEPQRVVLSLRVWSGLTFPEIAQVLETPKPTIKSRMRYGLEKMSALLKESRLP